MNVIHKNVLVKLPVEQDKEGIYVPSDEKIDERLGTVILCGEAVPDSVKALLEEEPTIKYKEYYDGTEETIDGVNYIIMSYESIIYIL